jgi:hypothetical protein
MPSQRKRPSLPARASVQARADIHHFEPACGPIPVDSATSVSADRHRPPSWLARLSPVNCSGAPAGLSLNRPCRHSPAHPGSTLFGPGLARPRLIVAGSRAQHFALPGPSAQFCCSFAIMDPRLHDRAKLSMCGRSDAPPCAASQLKEHYQKRHLSFNAAAKRVLC